MSFQLGCRCKKNGYSSKWKWSIKKINLSTKWKELKKKSFSVNQNISDLGFIIKAKETRGYSSKNGQRPIPFNSVAGGAQLGWKKSGIHPFLSQRWGRSEFTSPTSQDHGESNSRRGSGGKGWGGWGTCLWPWRGRGWGILTCFLDLKTFQKSSPA